MGKRGPPKKPTALKKMQGTYRPDRAPKHEVQPDGGVPACPADLSGPARDYWQELAPKLHKYGLLTELDVPQFRILATAWGRKAEAEEEIRKNGGPYYQTPTGYFRLHPANKVRDQAEKVVNQLAPRFGMDPAGRTSIDVPPPVQADPDEAFLFRGTGPQLVKDDSGKKVAGGV